MSDIAISTSLRFGTAWPARPARVLAQPRGAGRHRRVPGVPAPRVPRAGVRVHRPGRAAAVPEADGRVAGAGRRERPARGSRPRRSSPTCAQPEELVPGQAAVLRDGDAARRVRHRACWSRATRAGRRRSRATPSIRRASARRTCSRRRRSSRSTTRTARRRITQRGEIRTVERLPRRAARRGRGQARQRRAPGCASSPRRSPRRRWRAQMQELLAALPAARWHQWEPPAATTCAAARSWRSAQPSTRATRSTRPTSSSRSTPTSWAASPASVRYVARLRGRAGACAGDGRRDEPALRRRERADATRARRPITALAAARRPRSRRSRARSRPRSAWPARRPRRLPARRADDAGRGGRGDLHGATAARRSWSPATSSRRPCTRSRTRSTTRSATSGATVVYTEPVDGRAGRASCSRCASSSPT